MVFDRHLQNNRKIFPFHPCFIKILMTLCPKAPPKDVCSVEPSFRTSESNCCYRIPLYCVYNPTTIFYRGVSGFVNGFPCGVWGRGLTTRLQYVGPFLFANLFWISWFVRSVEWRIVSLYYVNICIDSTSWYILPTKYFGLFYFYFHLRNSWYFDSGTSYFHFP